MENITYKEFIQNILNTRGRFECGEEYHERHHIIPRCLGGNDEEDNLIDLFAREHFIAHKLLVEENPNNNRLAYAWWMLSNVGDREITPDEYEESKIMFSNKLKELFKNPENHPMYGRHQSEDSKRKISKAHKGKYDGENNPNYGNYWTDEQRRHMSEINSNPSQEARDKMSASQKQRLADPKNNPMFGKHHTEESRQKIGDASRNRAPEVYEQISQKARERMKNPENNPMFGKHMSEAAKMKRNKTRRANHTCEKITIQLTRNDEVIKVFWSTRQVSQELLIDCGDVSKCCNGKQQSAGGYRWKYLYDNKLKDKIIPGAITLGLITEEEALKQLGQDKND